MIGELLKMLCKIENEINDLRQHGDIPHDSYDDISDWILEAKAIINDYDR